MSATSKNILAKEIRSKVLKRFLIQTLINGVALIYLIFSVIYISSGDFWITSLFVLVVLGVTLARAYRQKKEKLVDRFLLRNIDREFAELENSSHLLLKEEDELNDLEVIQVKKVQKELEKVIEKFQPKIKLKKAIYFLIVSIFIGTAILLFPLFKAKTAEKQSISPDVQRSELSDKEVQLPQLRNITATVYPPSYTQIKRFKVSEGEIQVPEGSHVSIQAGFTDSIEQAVIQINEKEFSLKKQSQTENIYTLDMQWNQSGVFQIKYFLNDSLFKYSDLKKVIVVPDKPPTIGISGLEVYSIVNEAYSDPEFQIKIADDYGLSNGSIIATITKGEGESVKFREEKIPLSRSIKPNSTSHNLTQKIELNALNMEPGDELYFYVAASDRKSPQPNLSRSPTFFLVMPDTTNDVITMEAGLGVDLMPEYFRSQRQIIIDTEKLIAERGKIEKSEFDLKSNGLAHDQKVLRLRYGQFLGEEFESGIGQEGTLDENDSQESEVDVLEEYGHDHDTQEAQDRGVLDKHDDHDHNHEGEMLADGKDESEKLLEELTHTHDSEENATLFFESSKVKLKAALSLMWDSELHLRLNQPEQALPIEYEILKLLKEVQQMSRIYVKRIGFDPPPIKMFEKRLTGETDEIEAYRSNINPGKDFPTFESTTILIQEINNALAEDKPEILIPVELFELAFQEIQTEILVDPIRYFDLIEAMNQGLNAESFTKIEITDLQRLLTTLVAENPSIENKSYDYSNSINKIFLDEISNPTSLD